MVGTAPAHLANDKFVHVIVERECWNAWNVPVNHLLLIGLRVKKGGSSVNHLLLMGSFMV